METTPEGKYKDRYRISSARASWHSYNGGYYHVTICTKDRELYFGEIVDGSMRLSEIGRYAEEQFQNVTSYYPFAYIPLFIVMPNHIHAIVVIDNRAPRRDAIHRVSDIHRVKDDTMDDSSIDSETTKGGLTGNDNPMLHQRLGTVVRGLKARVTHYANEKGIAFAWQSRFHDRIIRNQMDLNETAKYVEDNVAKWKEDEMHP
jgi:REP element-mobilizing transposase RayT